jgi:hypothetical protein
MSNHTFQEGWRMNSKWWENLDLGKGVAGAGRMGEVTGEGEAIGGWDLN